MSYESPHTPEEVFNMRESIQHTLIDRFYGFHVEDNDHIKNWIKEYAADFAKAFDATLDRRPDLIELFKDDSDVAVELVERELQTIHASHN